MKERRPAWDAVGLVGLGLMGSALAERLRAAGHAVLGFDIDPARRAALAEGLAFAEALGFAPAQALAVLRASPAYSRAMDVKGDKMVRRDFTPAARLSQHRKDVDLILAAGRRARARLPLSRAHRGILRRAEAAGLGGLDNCAVLRVLGRPL